MKKERHQVQLKRVPIAFDKYANRYVCQKCGARFVEVPSTRCCPAPKYYKVVKYKDPR